MAGTNGLGDLWAKVIGPGPHRVAITGPPD